MVGIGRYCCKNPFALAIKNLPGFRRDFRVKMWGTSSSDEKLADGLGRLRAHESAIVGRIFLQQENSRRAIWDFCNKIGTKRLSPPTHLSVESASAAPPPLRRGA
jgi:hypothetical protein